LLRLVCDREELEGKAMESLQGMSIFRSVAELGSFSACAARLHLNRALVTRAVMQLEKDLGARLLNRTTRKVSLTPVGQAYLDRIVPALAELEAAREVAGSLTELVEGTIRMTVPMSLGYGFLGPVLADFMREHPQLKLEVSLNDRMVDLHEDGLDLALRVASNPSPHQISRRVSFAHMGVFATPSYLARMGTPTHPEQLARNHLGTSYSNTLRDGWLLRDPKSGEPFLVPINAPLKANNGDLLSALAESSLAMVFGPTFTLASALQRGTLVPVLRDFWPAPLTVQAAMPSRRFQPVKVKKLIDFLIDRWGVNPPWGLGLAAAGTSAP
jgi:DNA-binding transcriptional LysR family regulator